MEAIYSFGQVSIVCGLTGVLQRQSTNTLTGQDIGHVTAFSLGKFENTVDYGKDKKQNVANAVHNMPGWKDHVIYCLFR